MDYFSKKINEDEVQLALPGDVHIGSLNALKKAFEATVDYCIDNDAYMILMGDLIDAIAPSDIRYDASNVDRECLTIGEQFDYLESQLSRMPKGKILGMVIGNHYGKWAIKACTDEKSRMCKRLGARFLGLHALYNLKTSEDSFNLSLWHGAGGGYQIGTTMNKLAREPASFSADVYAQGHSHNLFHFRKPLLDFEDNEEDRQKIKLFCNTGSYLKTYCEGVGGYGESKGYSPQMIGFTLLKFKNGELPVANDVVWHHEHFCTENVAKDAITVKSIERQIRTLDKEQKVELLDYLSRKVIQ